MKLNTFKVKHKDREMEVIIPDTGDTAENAYLEEVEREKTLDQLKKSPPKEKSKLSKEEKKLAIKEIKRYQDRRKQNAIPRYFSGDYTS